MSNDAKFGVKADDKTRKAFESLDKRLKETEKNSEHLTRKFKQLNNVGLGVKKAFGGIAVAAGAWGVKSQIEESVAFADALAKTADKLGLTTDELQEYRFAAKLSNIEQTALDTGMQRWIRRLGEAASGSGDLKKVLEANNIAIRDENGQLRDSNAVLGDYADAIQGAETDQEKLLLSFKAFDTEGVAMVNMLRDGSQGLQELRQNARDSGAVMDSELIRKAEIINDKWETLTHTIGVELKSALISVADVFVDTATNAEKMDIIAVKMRAINLEIEHGAQMGRREFGGEIERLKQLGIEYQKLNDIKSGKGAAGGGGTEAQIEAEKAKNIELQTISNAYQKLNNENRLTVVKEGLDQEAHLKRQAHAQMLLDQQSIEQQATMNAQQQALARVGYIGQIMGNLSSLMTSKNKKLFQVGKLASISSAIVNTSLAMTKTMTSAPYPWNIPLVAAQGVAGYAQVQNIRGQQFSGAREHGGPVVGGNLYKVNDGAGNPKELFRPNSSGQIISNKNINKGGDNYFSLNIEMQSDAQMDDWADRNQGRLFGYMLETMRERNLRFA